MRRDEREARVEECGAEHPRPQGSRAPVARGLVHDLPGDSVPRQQLRGVGRVAHGGGDARPERRRLAWVPRAHALAATILRHNARRADRPELVRVRGVVDGAADPREDRRVDVLGGGQQRVERAASMEKGRVAWHSMPRVQHAARRHARWRTSETRWMSRHVEAHSAGGGLARRMCEPGSAVDAFSVHVCVASEL